MTIELILGTAGHIDHGKTALVAALTGIDTDRLPEEKQRGITIELGFASLDVGDYRLGIVDVPGHERFVRQMLAGAAGMDIAMLIVAADDSVKPQTREHVDILRLMRAKAGVIVLTKSDLADPEWMGLVEAEVGELVKGTFLESAPIVRTSSVTGQGIDELKAALVRAADVAASRLDLDASASPFRMPIDRTFSIAGHGTVVTGSVLTGVAAVGDQLTIQPGDHPVRVRGIQNHDHTVDRIQRGQRAAINLAGLDHGALSRGHELCTTGHLRASTLLTVELSVLPAVPVALKHRDLVRVHLGTAEALANVAILGEPEIVPGSRGVAQLFLREPVVATWRQPFVIRRESPVTTLGGGVVLVPEAEKIKRLDDQQKQRLHELLGDDEETRVTAALYFQGLRTWQPEDLPRIAGVSAATDVLDRLAENEKTVRLAVSPTRAVCLEQNVIDEWIHRLDVALMRLHEAQPLRSTIHRESLLQRFDYVGDRQVLAALLDLACERGDIRDSPKGVASHQHSLQLTAKQTAALEGIVAEFLAAGFQPPSIADCQKRFPRQERDVQKLIELAVANDDLIHIGKQMYLHADHVVQLKSRVGERLSQEAGLTLSQIREILGTTRKYAVPLCEYLDRIRFTQRDGDLRIRGDDTP